MKQSVSPHADAATPLANWVLPKSGKFEGEFTVPCNEMGMKFQSVTFKENSAIFGGALANPAQQKNSILSIQDSTFQSNTATERGGAIAISGQNSLADVSQTDFTTNTASGSGGAVAVENSAMLVMNGGSATSNTAVADGGFVFARFARFPLFKSVTVKSCTSSSGRGGAFAFLATTVAIVDSSINACTANTGGGGAVLLDGESQAHIVSVTFDGNQGKLNPQRLHFRCQNFP